MGHSFEAFGAVRFYRSDRASGIGLLIINSIVWLGVPTQSHSLARSHKHPLTPLLSGAFTLATVNRSYRVDPAHETTFSDPASEFLSTQ